MKWLDLPEAVLPAMTAFASGLGGEGTETFAQILLKDPILKENPVVITQVSSCAPLALVCKRLVIPICLQLKFYLYSQGSKINISDMHILLSSCVGDWQSLYPLTARGSDEHEAQLLSLELSFYVFDAVALQNREWSNFLLRVIIAVVLIHICVLQ